MRIYGGVTSSARKTLSFLVGDMSVSPRIAEQLCEAKVDDMHKIAATSSTDKKVVWFDVAMNVALCVNHL